MMATFASRPSRRGYGRSFRRLGKEVTRWSGQVLDTIDYCAFIGLNPGSKSVYVVTGDSGQGMTHGALAGLLLKDLILGESSPGRKSTSRRARRPPASINYVRENLSAVKKPGRIPAARRSEIPRRAVVWTRRYFAGGIAKNRCLSRSWRQTASALCRLYAFGMRSRLELDRAMLGLLMPWIAFCAGRGSPERSSSAPPPPNQTTGVRLASVISCGRRSYPAFFKSALRGG